MKYLYYYLWLINAKCYFYIGLLAKKMKVKRNQDDKSFNKEVLDFPDGVTHWYAFGFTSLFIITVFVFIPLFTMDFVIETLDTGFKFVIYVLVIMAITWYLIYIYKGNKDWLKKKINKKSKDFYL